ncbi:hypothetical protein QQY66_33095 [Streptomyces sp. DG2A-72]|uniref:hypothetical protein n=1 Tax=Streptomyces sp. DG2A-72 TaxID=3051386 RepID=UPI00265C0089|nr:hypothetical protein [Streptomyces sp. DG2A-72]MDO0936308.1 hypothetical protein [Streptomyces sp. DG2A-72]
MTDGGTASVRTRTVLRAVARAVLAGVLGAVAGIVAYSLSQTGGQSLSVVVGGLLGVAAALGGDLYRRSVQLTEVRLVLPGSEMTFKANTDMRQAAQRMFFQASTRIATRPLEDGSGNLREALTSLKTLFDLYREPLESGEAPPPPSHGDSVHELILDILNFELAPFLSKWHPRLQAFEQAHPDLDESAWPDNAAFRQELQTLQQNLRPYFVALGEIAGLRDPERHLRPSARRSDKPPSSPPHPLPGQRPATTDGTCPDPTPAADDTDDR